ncbi:hypothetical protein [Methylocapsa palsarum]|uniref:hypothetical protein n=1 Tax=Methylocapsa palsarum TaxID=1612308 RepID=UPI0011137968|nr:hypothetical protein [Methylocapsa palsarum]
MFHGGAIQSRNKGFADDYTERAPSAARFPASCELFLGSVALLQRMSRNAEDTELSAPAGPGYDPGLAAIIFPALECANFDSRRRVGRETS